MLDRLPDPLLLGLPDRLLDWLLVRLFGEGRALRRGITLRALADQAPTHGTDEALGTQHRDRPAWAPPRSRAEAVVVMPEAVWAAGNRARAGIGRRGRTQG